MCLWFVWTVGRNRSLIVSSQKHENGVELINLKNWPNFHFRFFQGFSIVMPVIPHNSHPVPDPILEIPSVQIGIVAAVVPPSPLIKLGTIGPNCSIIVPVFSRELLIGMAL